MYTSKSKHSLTRKLLIYRIDQWWCKKHRNKSDRNLTIFSPLLRLYLAHYSGMYCYNFSVLNIGLFQFSSQISVTLVSVLFTPPLVNPIYQQLSRMFLFTCFIRFFFCRSASLYVVTNSIFEGREVTKFNN